MIIIIIMHGQIGIKLVPPPGFYYERVARYTAGLKKQDLSKDGWPFM